MKITADSKVLLRTLVADDKAQAARAAEILVCAERVAINLRTLCEISWVLKTIYGVSRADRVAAIRALLNINNTVTNRPAAEAGFAVLASGGDFADGVIAFDGAWLGGQVFVSFDKKAVQLLEENGYSCQLLADQDV